MTWRFHFPLRNYDFKGMAYTTYVRPQVEYCSTIWNPWQKTLSQKIESVQRSAARYVCNNYNYTSTECDIHVEITKLAYTWVQT